MCVLYAVANHLNGRVIGTGNRSELLVSHTTLWGDSVCDLAVLGDLYVDEVVELGELLGLPTRFTRKVPSDGMCGKTDEEKLGFSYAALKLACENPFAAEKTYGADETTKILKRIEASRWKKALLAGIPQVSEFMESGT
jgi:NAD+ synthase